MSREVNTEHVRCSIENFLEQDKWNNNHLQFYEMLIDVARKYNKKAHHYKNFTNDNSDIINNIREQPWFSLSKNQELIITLLKNMYVESITTNPAYTVRLKLGNNLWFMIEYLNRQHRGCKEIKYRVSLCDNMDKHAYICYYSSKSQKSRKLPEYEGLEKYLPELSRYDIIMLANELIIYYDCDHSLTKIPIGHDYPLTLGKLALEIIKNPLNKK